MAAASHKTDNLRKIIVNTFAGAALLVATIGVYMAIHSPLFLVQVVEVSDQPEEAPVDAQTITQLAAIPAGLVNLFDLDLRAVERRILTNPWIREVRLQKRFPQTLSISVIYRQPKLLFQDSRGALSYVDSDGKVFGQVNLRLQSDLPILGGVQRDDHPVIAQALGLVEAWDGSPLRTQAQISSLNWDAEHGFRALVVYQFKNSKVRSRTVVDLGQDFDVVGVSTQTGHLPDQLKRVSEVISYLSGHSIAAHQIWADAGKKIVVKTAHGS